MPVWFLGSEYGQLSFAVKMGWALVLNVCMTWGCEVIGMHESDGNQAVNITSHLMLTAAMPLTWSNIAQPGTFENNFSLMHVIAMFFVNALLSMLITWYVEAVRPGDQGVPQPFYFPFLVGCFCLVQS